MVKVDLSHVHHDKTHLNSIKKRDRHLGECTLKRGIRQTGFRASCLYSCIFNGNDFSTLSSLGHYVHSCTYANVDFRGLNWEFSCFEKCSFENCNCSYPHATGVIFNNCEFVNCDFTKFHIGFSVVSNCRFLHCNFRKAVLDEEGVVYADTAFVKCKFPQVTDKDMPVGDVVIQ